MHFVTAGSVGLLYAPQRVAADDRNLVARKTVVRQQLAELQLDQFQQLGIVHQVGLVEEHDQRRHVHLPGQQHVFARLRHRTVGRRNHQDRSVHLGGAGDHVLDEVGVAGAVDVGIVALVGFVLHVRHGDGDGLRRVADRAALGDVGIRLELRHALLFLDRQDRAGQRGLAVVNVADRAHIDVRFRPRKYFLGHGGVVLPALDLFGSVTRINLDGRNPSIFWQLEMSVNRRRQATASLTPRRRQYSETFDRPNQ